jgi:5'-nucleotidase
VRWRREIIAVDVDEVCFQLQKEWLRRYNEEYGDRLTIEDLTEWDISKFVHPHCGKAIFKYLKQTDLYDCIEPYPGTLGAVEAMRLAGHRVIFVSSCVRGGYDMKVEALVKHGLLPNDQRCLTDFYGASDKSLIEADVLIDDHVDNVNRFRGRSVLITRPWNATAPLTYHTVRAASLADAARMYLAGEV